MDMESKYTRMGIYTSVTSKKTRNMGKGNFIGSAYLHPLNKMHSMFSTTTGSGGVDFLMELDLIRNLQGIFMMDSLKMD